MSGRHDTRVSSEAWNALVEQYREAGGEAAPDHRLADLVRDKVYEIEGDA